MKILAKTGIFPHKTARLPTVIWDGDNWWRLMVSRVECWVLPCFIMDEAGSGHTLGAATPPLLPGLLESYRLNSYESSPTTHFNPLTHSTQTRLFQPIFSSLIILEPKYFAVIRLRSLWESRNSNHPLSKFERRTLCLLDADSNPSKIHLLSLNHLVT